MTIGLIGGNFFQSLPTQDHQKTATEAVISDQNNLRLKGDVKVVVDTDGKMFNLALDANA